jgi:hypothetical protein
VQLPRIACVVRISVALNQGPILVEQKAIASNLEPVLNFFYSSIILATKHPQLLRLAQL